MHQDDKLRIANEIAMKRGFPPYECDTPAQFTPDEGDTCAACDAPIIRAGFITRTSHEYDEWESYCSRACASGLHGVGDRAFFLERMGWTLWHSENVRNDVFLWAKMATADLDSPDFNRVVAREGDDTWMADCEIVAEMIAEFEQRIGANVRPAPEQYRDLRRIVGL